MIPETEGRAGMKVADSLTAKSRENLTEFSLRKKICTKLCYCNMLN